MDNLNAKYLTSQNGILRIVIVAIGFLSFILVVSAPYCEGALIWVALAFFLSTAITLSCIVVEVKSMTEKIQVGIPFQDVDVYLRTFSLVNSFLASIVLAANARSTILWIVADVIGFGLVLLHLLDLYLVKESIPENLNYVKTLKGALKTFIFVLGFTTFSLLDASTFRCYYPDGCNIARTWAFATFFACWAGSFFIFLLRLTWMSSGISRFDKIDFVWSVFAGLNYLIAALVLTAYLKCVSFAHHDCASRLASNVLGYAVALLHGVEIFLFASPQTPAQDNEIVADAEATTNEIEN